MEFTKTIKGDETILNFVGRVDTTNSAEFEDIIAKEIKLGSKIILNFEKIDYISSAGLRALLSCHKLCKEAKATFTIKHINNEVLEVFDITGFSSILNIED